eukprot:6602402-Prymnesium_polylepis.1
MRSWAAGADALVSLYVQHEQVAHRLCSALMIAVGCCVLLVELGLKARAPYGRYATLAAAARYGPTIDPRLAWAFQESWSVSVPLALLFVSEPTCLEAPRNLLLLAMFVGHYAYRTIVYPLRLCGSSRMPVGLCLLAAAFCAFNGFVQGRMWTAITVHSADSPLERASFALGCTLWVVGLAINLHSDAILRNLRGPGETGYKIPRGGAFELVSGANYFGEVVEWLGYAIAARTFGAAAFAFFTFANLGPRAQHHHAWYLSKFEDYPQFRRALIPWVW